MTAPERKDATALVDEWLMELENYGLRIERLAESFPSDMGELMPWLVAACDCGLSQHQAALDRIAELEAALKVTVAFLDYPIEQGHAITMDEPDGWRETARAVLAKGDG